MNPLLSAESYLNGVYNHFKAPIAPPGIKVEVQEKTSIRPTFGYHSTSRWYIDWTSSSPIPLLQSVRPFYGS